jgi:hypothetical protein
MNAQMLVWVLFHWRTDLGQQAFIEKSKERRKYLLLCQVTTGTHNHNRQAG